MLPLAADIYYPVWKLGIYSNEYERNSVVSFLAQAPFFFLRRLALNSPKETIAGLMGSKDDHFRG